MADPTPDQIRAALAEVEDPEIKRPITELGMVDAIEVTGSHVDVRILLTIAGCPMRDTLESSVRAAVAGVPGVETVEVELQPMSDEQRAELRERLHGPTRDIPFTRPTSTTTVIAIASGKGGVGKSSVTVNLALALTELGNQVGILDADIYGHSIPGMLGIPDARPTGVEGMIMPVPVLGMKVISMGMFKENRRDVVAWRGPILDKALQQMLADVYWGDLDFLLLDLPPGTGDIAMSLGQKLPNAEVIVVTTPQLAAAEVAERAGSMATMMRQRVIGVVENMSYLEVPCPHCGKPVTVDVFGSGGGAEAARMIAETAGADVPLLAQIPLEPKLREGGDEGSPIVASEPDSPAGKAFTTLAAALAHRSVALAGRSLGLNPQR